MTAPDQDRPWALVTGASAGIGAELAELLAESGHQLILVARRQDRLDELASRLRASSGVEVEVLPADLTDPAQRHLVERRIRSLDRLDLLINNAGFAGYRAFWEVDPEVVSELIELHCLACARLCRAAVPGMVERRRGGLINVASLLGFSAGVPMGQMPGRATYVGAKAFMIAFTRSLAQELKPHGVRAVVACPGVVETEFHQVAGVGGPLPNSMSARDAAETILRGYQLGEAVVVPGLEEAKLIPQAERAQAAILRAGNRSSPATRYRSSY